MKTWMLRFLVSRVGGVLTPIIAGLVGAAVAKLASYDAALAASVDSNAVTAFVVAAVMSAVNYATNAVQTDNIKSLQGMINVPQDGVFGPVTYTEVRKALPAGDV
jgi:uncharacterized membrane protein YeaQ/YmgE (transglycosylase-associated protein family)